MLAQAPNRKSEATIEQIIEKQKKHKQETSRLMTSPYSINSDSGTRVLFLHYACFVAAAAKIVGRKIAQFLIHYF